MRYPIDQPPDPDAPYGATMHDMLTLSMLLSIVIGLCLYLAARRGRVMWLKAWSAALILCSALYLGADAIGLF